MNLLSWFKNKFSNRKTNLSSTKVQSNNDNNLIRFLNEESKKRSEQFYEQHQNKYIGWDPQTDLIETDSSPLTSVEISFLDYIDSKKVHELSLPGYWTYEYNLDFKYVISKLINNGYLIVTSTPNLNKLKVDELKDILRKYSLKVSGKKADLIKRIEENITEEQLSQYFESYGELYYKSTQTGKQLIKSTPSSVTKDIEFEDECIQLIEQRDLNGAYKLVCKRESMKSLKRGIGIDWDQKLKQGIQQNTLYVYQKLIDTVIPEIPSTALKAAINAYIFCDMLGKYPSTKLFNRLTNNQYRNEASDYLDCVEYEFLNLKAEYEIIDLKRNYPNKRYEILLAEDGNDCETCLKFKNKKLSISKAQVGVNFPPFHQGCRCTAIPYFKD